MSKHTLCGYSMDTQCSFDTTKGEDFISMKNICKDLREDAIETTDCKKMEMTPLADDESKSYTNQTICNMCKK